MLAAREQPGQRKLCHRAVGIAREFGVALEQLQVARVVVRLEARHRAPDVLRFEAVQVAQLAGQEGARQRTEGDEGDAELARRLQRAEFGVAGPERVFVLQRGDRMHRVGPAQRRGRYLGQADRADLAGAHQVGQRADAVLDRHLLVPAVQVVQIDHVGAQPTQAVLAGLLQRLRPAVDHPLAVDALHAALARQREPRAVRRQHAADQFLVGAEAVQRGGVEQRHAQIERAAAAVARPARAAAACRRHGSGSCSRVRWRRR